jgi:hypothetical protein
MMDENGCTFREGSEADFGEIAELMERERYGPSQLAWSRLDYLHWIRWKYLGNPDGPARVLLIEDLDGKIVGLQALLPRRFTGKRTDTMTVMHNVDAYLTAEHRRKGVFSDLTAFSRRTIIAPRITFPSEVVLRINIRNKQRKIFPLEVWWFPVSLVGSNPGRTHRILAPLAEIPVRLYASLRLGRCSRTICMRPVERFQRDFALDDDSLHGVRSAEYLNWRFLDNPMYKYSAFEFVENDEIIGYCVYTTIHGKMELFDFAAERNPRECFRLLVEHCRQARLPRLRFRGVGLCLGKYGFFRRTDPAATFTISRTVDGPFYITMADRDF